MQNQTKGLMKVLGVTGGIGSGKSTVCNVFTTMGIPVFSADQVSKEILFSSHVSQEVVDLFGNQIVTNGVLDRVKLAAIVFSDKERLNTLNTILHPKVDEAFNQWKIHQSAPFVIKEAAILFETGGDKKCDWILHVSCSEIIRIKRVTKRDQRSLEEVKKIIGNQWPDNKKEKRSDFIIRNENEKIIPKIFNLYNSILSLV